MPRRQASLYHFNLGLPALSAGTVVTSGGRRLLGPVAVPDEAATREAAHHPLTGRPGECRVLTKDLAVDFAWSAATLPHLQLWHDLRPGTCVLSVEPCTSERLPGGRSGEEPMHRTRRHPSIRPLGVCRCSAAIRKSQRTFQDRVGTSHSCHMWTAPVQDAPTKFYGWQPAKEGIDLKR